MNWAQRENTQMEIHEMDDMFFLQVRIDRK